MQRDFPQAQGRAKGDCHKNGSSEKDSRERKAERISQGSQRSRRKRTARIAQRGKSGLVEAVLYRTRKSIETNDTDQERTEEREPIAPPSDRKRSRHAMPTPVSSRRRAFCTATEIGEIWNPHASPRRPVVVTSNKGENPRPVSPIATQAKAAVAAVVIPLNYQLVLGLSPGSTGLRMIPLTSGERSGRTASVSTVLRQIHRNQGHRVIDRAAGASFLPMRM